jgi:diacylglycerol kinase (ATP)
MILNPKADHWDGIFDICTINYMPLWRTLRLLPAIRGGGHSGHDGVSFSRSRAVYIESRRPINCQFDGEVAQGTTFDVRNLPGALLVRC